MSEHVHTAKVNIPGFVLGKRGEQVIIDGKDMTHLVRSVRFRGVVGDVNTLELGLILRDGVHIDARTEVVIDRDTAELLKSFGWASPDEVAELRRAATAYAKQIGDLKAELAEAGG